MARFLSHNKWDMNTEVFICPLRECNSFEWYKLYEDHRSPAGARVESVTIKDRLTGEIEQNRGLEVQVRLMGAYHDGTIDFTYTGVRRYSVEGTRDVAGHPSWLEDDLDIRRHDSLLHSVTLTNGSFEIEADDIEYKWTPLPALSGL